MAVTLHEVEDALDSHPATDGVIVMHVQEDGSIKRLADRGAVPNYPGHIVVLNDRAEAAALIHAPSRPVSTPSQPVDPASPGDQPTSDEPPHGRET